LAKYQNEVKKNTLSNNANVSKWANSSMFTNASKQLT